MICLKSHFVKNNGESNHEIKILNRIMSWVNRYIPIRNKTFFNNPRFVLIIHDRRLVLFYRRVSGSERKVFITFEIWIFCYKNTWICYRRPLFTPPEPCEACFITDAHALFHVFWTVDKKHPIILIVTLRRARTVFNITLIGFIWKKKVIYTYDASRVSKSQANLNFWVN